MEINVSESVKLSYTIHDYSCYSSNYTPENILVNKPSIPLSRWFTDSVAPSHFVTLKLQSTSIVETITFGKYIKAHPSDLKKFRVYGGMHEKDLKLLLSAGLKNNNKTEKFSLSYKTSEGFNLPVNYIKIVPLQSWGAANNFSIWYVELHGKNQPEIIADCDFNYRLSVEESDVRCILSFLRRRQYAGAFAALARETGVSMGCGAALRLWDALVEREDYDRAEAILQQAADDGEFELHLRSSRAAVSWELLTPLSPEVDAALACSAADEQPPAPADPVDEPPPDTYEQIETTSLDVDDTGEAPVVGIDLTMVEFTSSTSQCSSDLSLDSDSAVHTDTQSAACTRSITVATGTKEDLVSYTVTSTKQAAVTEAVTVTESDTVAVAANGITENIAATANAEMASGTKDNAEAIVNAKKANEATIANVKNEETTVANEAVSIDTQEVISTDANKLVIMDAEKSDKVVLVEAPSSPAVSVEPAASAAPEDNAAPKDNAVSTDNAPQADNAASSDTATSANNVGLCDNAIPSDNATPADNAASTDTATANDVGLCDNALPSDNAAPADNAASTDTATSANNVDLCDNAIPTDNATPADNVASTCTATSANNVGLCDNATPAVNTTLSSPKSLMRLSPNDAVSAELPADLNGEECMRPRARGGHQLVVDTDTGTLYLFGGWDGREDLDDLWSFSARSRRWALLCAHCGRAGGPSPRSCHKMVYDPARRCLYLLGRFVDSGCRNRDTLRSELYKYDVPSGRWSVACADTAAAGGPRQVFDHQLCIDARLQVLFVFGGRVLPGPVDQHADSPEQECSQPKYSGLYAYYIARGRWQCMLPDEHRLPAPQPRVSHNMLYHPVERRLYIFGGQRQKRPLLDMWRVDVVSGRCAALRPPAARRAAPAPAAGCTQRAAIDHPADRIYVLTGMNKDREARVCNELWVLDLRTQRWARQYRSGAAGAAAGGVGDEPLPRFAHQFVYDHVAETHYLFGGNPGCAGSAGGAGGAGSAACGAGARLRLDDMWALRVRYPATGALLRRLRRALRELRYRALLTDRRHCDALVYLRDRLRPLVDHADRQESMYYKELSSLLLRDLPLPPPPARLTPRTCVPPLEDFLKDSAWQTCAVREPRPQSPPDGVAGEGPGCACDASGRCGPEAGRARVLRMQVYDQLCEHFAPHRRPARDVSNISVCSSHQLIDSYF